MVAATALRKTGTTRLRESYDLGGSATRVDREAGVIKGVKIVGRSSPNRHGVAGVDGTDYTMEALQEEAQLLEGINVNVGHRPRGRDGKPLPVDRDPRDRFAWLQNVHVTESGSYGDLHFLDPTDPLAVRVMNAAEKKPDAYALSHDAPTARYEIRNRRLVIVSIPKVVSVDLVADGGTNVSLFESGQGENMVTISDKWGANLLLRPRLVKLLEAAPEAGDMAVGEGGDHMDDLYAAFKKLCQEDPEKAKKVHKLMIDGALPEDEESEEEPAKEEDKKDAKEPAAEKVPEEDPKGGKKSEGGTMESREAVRLGRENRLLRVALQESVSLTAEQLEAGVALDSEAKVKAFVKSLKGQAKSGAPRSQAAGSVGLYESRDLPKTREARLKALRR